MNMASIGICILIIISLIALNAKAAFLTVKCTTEVVGQYGQQSMLKCMVQTIDKDTTIRAVAWKKIGGVKNALLVFHDGEMKLQPGYEFAEQSWDEKNMNVSLHIANTKVADAGGYECMVMTDSGEGSAEVHLRVVAKYRAPVINSSPKEITPNSGGTLTCDTVGGYPQGSIHWFDEFGSDWTPSAKMEAEAETEDGLFHLSSKLPLKGGSTFSKYTCQVLNASGGKEAESTIDIEPEASGLGREETKQRTTHIVAAVVVIGSLIVGLLLAIYLHKRRSQNTHQEVCSCELEDHQHTAEEV